jgi:hypothetical protein
LAGGVFGEEQDVELAEPDGVDDEGVAGGDPAGLSGEELGPGRSGASGGGIDAVPFQDRPHRRWGEADDELFAVTHGAGPAGPSLAGASIGPRPAACAR